MAVAEHARKSRFGGPQWPGVGSVWVRRAAGTPPGRKSMCAAGKAQAANVSGGRGAPRVGRYHPLINAGRCCHGGCRRDGVG